MQSFDQALQVIAGIMRDGVAKHPDNEWTRRGTEYHLGRAEEHLRLLRDGEHLEDHLAHAATRLLMALTLRGEAEERVPGRFVQFYTLSACPYGPAASADELPIEDILAIKHDIVPLDGPDVFQQGKIDSIAGWVALA